MMLMMRRRIHQQVVQLCACSFPVSVALRCALLAWVGCSSASDSADAAADCGPHEVQRFDESTRCSRPATVSGLCERSLRKNSATVEQVCAVAPDGTMFIVSAGGDTFLSGQGWTFGPRRLGHEGTNTYDVERESLTESDKPRCDAAQAALGLPDSGAGCVALRGDGG
jgi:hypothetical protein